MAVFQLPASMWREVEVGAPYRLHAGAPVEADITAHCQTRRAARSATRSRDTRGGPSLVRILAADDVELPISDRDAGNAHRQLASFGRPSSKFGFAGMAVTIDVGDLNDIHPQNKKAVGERLARWALAREYDRPIVTSGPLPRRARFASETVVVEFDHPAGFERSTERLQQSSN